MKVVVTGMVGIDKRRYLESVCRLAHDKGHDITLCNVGEQMYAEAPDIPAGKILDISMKRLRSLRRSVFKDIIAKSRTTENIIINTHATFRWRHGLFPAIDFDQMRELDADMYICLVDDITALHTRLTDEHSTEHTLKDLIVWREEELLGTEMLANGINEKAPLYCLARGIEKETAETFYRLMFEENREKAYLSFPMTHVWDIEEIRAEITEFIQIMNRVFTCFDPGDIEESYLPRLARKALQDNKKFMELETLGQNMIFDCEQVLQIEKDINSQIYTRDFLLIDQSDMIISYIPTLPDGRASISSGVERELQHAHEGAKDVFVIWKADQEPSVFVTQTATKVFRSLEDAVTYFKEKGYA